MPIERLLGIMTRLRDPVSGCPWDLKQDFRSVAPHTLEEAYEVADAIERNDLPALRDALAEPEEPSRVGERMKAGERVPRGHGDGFLGGIPAPLPALTRARKLGSRA